MISQLILKKQTKMIIALVCTYCASAHADAQPNLLKNLVKDMQPGTWAKVNQNSFNSVWAPLALRAPQISGPSSNPSKIISAWSSFAWDSNRSQMILYGGGHANYAGDEVYIWDGSTLQWERGSLPTNLQTTSINGVTEYLTVDNGATPQSAHTYDNNVFLPILDRFLTLGGFTYGPGSPYRQVENGAFTLTGPYLFDPNLADGNKVGGATGTGVNPSTVGGNMWQNRDIYSNPNIPSATIPKGFGQGMTGVTERDGKDVVYVSAGGSLYQYIINDINNPATDSWIKVGDVHPSAFAQQGAGAYDPTLNIFVRTGVTTSSLTWNFFFWDLSNPGSRNTGQSFNVTDNTGGLFSWNDIKGMGLDYDPVGDRFLLWGGGAAVYSLSHQTGSSLNSGWTLDVENSLSLNGPGGTAANDPNLLLSSMAGAGGVLGKWDFASDLNAFIGLRDPTNGEVWVYKPTNYVDPAPVPVPPAIWLFGSALGALATFRHTSVKRNTSA